MVFREPDEAVTIWCATCGPSRPLMTAEIDYLQDDDAFVIPLCPGCGCTAQAGFAPTPSEKPE